MKYACVVTALLASVTVAAGRQPQFKSGVEVVYLDVTVQAPDGSIVRGLAKDDFLIYDEEVPQDVAVFSAEPAPISVGVLIDTSGSMTGERMAAAIRAADALGHSLQPGDRWSISTFDSTRRTMITWRPYNPGIVNSLRAMPTSGSTELFRAVTEMVPYMKETPHRKRAMLLMTDGIDNSIIAASRDGRGDPFEAPGPLESPPRRRQRCAKAMLLYALGINVAGEQAPCTCRRCNDSPNPRAGPSSLGRRFVRWKRRRNGWPKNCVSSTPWGSIRRTPATKPITA
jgi:hypothetical protein